MTIKRTTPEKTFRDLFEELNDNEISTHEQLDEFRVIRGGTALVLAAKSKTSGDKVVQIARSGKSKLDRIKQKSSPEEQINILSDALGDIFDCLIENRNQIGNLVGISLASVLISERSEKNFTKLFNKRR